MAKKRLLIFAHGHPSRTAGGGERYARELYEGFRGSAAFTPVLVARAGPPGGETAPSRLPHPGTRYATADGDPNQLLVYTHLDEFDRFHLSVRDKDFYPEWIDPVLEAYPPDVIHLQHTLFFGIDLVRYLHDRWPHVPVVYTLHEFYPVCHNDGQMYRTAAAGRGPCREASPRRCHECFPDISPQAFHLRKRLIQAQLGPIARFVAPSRFLADRFVEWGVAADRVVVEEYGRPFPAPADEPAAPPRPRTRFGFFGQLTAFKGWDVLLRAVALLASGGGGPASFSLRLHGANLGAQPPAVQEEAARLLAEAGPAVVFAGPYAPGEAVDRMGGVDWVVVPSVWWENSPLVIQEAFAAGRPVICSDIGGMGEKVRDGIDGLHFRAGDPADLAAVLRRACQSPGLWEELRAGVRPVHPMTDHVSRLSALYEPCSQPGGRPRDDPDPGRSHARPRRPIRRRRAGRVSRSRVELGRPGPPGRVRPPSPRLRPSHRPTRPLPPAGRDGRPPGPAGPPRPGLLGYFARPQADDPADGWVLEVRAPGRPEAAVACGPAAGDAAAARRTILDLLDLDPRDGGASPTSWSRPWRRSSGARG